MAPTSETGRPDARSPARRRTVHLAAAALVGITAIWGFTFVVVKDTIPPRGPMASLDFLAWRFAVASVVMACARPRSLAGMTPRTLRRGLLLGLVLSAGYVTQTVGLESTPAGISGFITGMFVVFTPLVAAVVLRRRIQAPAWAGVALATGGLALLSTGSSGTGSASATGVILTLVGALAFAGHIVGLGTWSDRSDTVGFVLPQLATVAAVTFLGTLATGHRPSPPPNAAAWGAVLLTAVAGTAIAFFVQSWAQAVLDPTKAAVILTMEPVFTGICAVLLAGESFGIRTAEGSALVLAAMLVVELAPARLPGRRDAPAAIPAPRTADPAEHMR